MTQRTLIIGKSPAALEGMSSLLQEQGYEVETTNDFNNIAGRFDLKQFDLITTGGQVPPEARVRIRNDALKLKPGMRFVQGMAAISGLVVDQIKGELTVQGQNAEQIPVYDPANRMFTFTTANAVSVKITA
jgi:CheY-like chemotaxis protein